MAKVKNNQQKTASISQEIQNTTTQTFLKENQNQGHNTQKEALGPNTRR